MLKVGDLVRLKNHPTDKEFWVGIVRRMYTREGFTSQARVFWPSSDKVFTFLCSDLEIIT
jgi:hypothetical protein